MGEGVGWPAGRRHRAALEQRVSSSSYCGPRCGTAMSGPMPPAALSGARARWLAPAATLRTPPTARAAGPALRAALQPHLPVVGAHQALLRAGLRRHRAPQVSARPPAALRGPRCGGCWAGCRAGLHACGMLAAGADSEHCRLSTLTTTHCWSALAPSPDASERRFGSLEVLQAAKEAGRQRGQKIKASRAGRKEERK